MSIYSLRVQDLDKLAEKKTLVILTFRYNGFGSEKRIRLRVLKSIKISI
jgi:hypothetical protein